MAATPGTPGDPVTGAPGITGQIYVGDDPTGGAGVLQGRWWRVDPVEVPEPAGP